ncbi:MAG: Maf family protein, partial [Deltaproteobacteria bacterium]|nr:Maf family protein [Deltaproteobacteria bacterium]
MEARRLRDASARRRKGSVEDPLQAEFPEATVPRGDPDPYLSATVRQGEALEGVGPLLEGKGGLAVARGRGDGHGARGPPPGRVLGVAGADPQGSLPRQSRPGQQEAPPGSTGFGVPEDKTVPGPARDPADLPAGGRLRGAGACGAGPAPRTGPGSGPGRLPHHRGVGPGRAELPQQPLRAAIHPADPQPVQLLVQGRSVSKVLEVLRQRGAVPHGPHDPDPRGPGQPERVRRLVHVQEPERDPGAAIEVSEPDAAPGAPERLHADQVSGGELPGNPRRGPGPVPVPGRGDPQGRQHQQEDRQDRQDHRERGRGPSPPALESPGVHGSSRAAGYPRRRPLTREAPPPYHSDPGLTEVAMPVQLVLASQSPRRKELLERTGFTIRTMPADIDESRGEGESPTEFVKRIARAKVLAVVDRLHSTTSNLADAASHPVPGLLSQKEASLRWVVGADTVVVLGEDVLG